MLVSYDPSMAEQRVFSRLQCPPIEATIAIGGTLLDLSLGGVFVACDSPPPQGSIVNLRFSLPGTEEPFCLLSKVRWTGSRISAENLSQYGMGLEFLSVPHDQALALHKHVRTLQRLSCVGDRSNLQLSVQLQTGGGAFSGQVYAVSPKFVWLSTPQALEVATPLTIVVKSPHGSELLELAGVIVELMPGWYVNEDAVLLHRAKVSLEDRSHATQQAMAVIMEMARRARPGLSQRAAP